MNEIKLSICIPTYNRLPHIKRHILYFENELKSNNNSCLEVIISNNASTDGTTDFLLQYANKHNWLTINNNAENIGARANMQKLLEMAKGEYIWIPGDDDYLKKGLISRLLNILNNNELNYIYLSRRTIIEKSKKVELEDKTHCVKYDEPIKVSHKQLVNLVLENFGDLKFQTSSIFKRGSIIRYEKDSHIYAADVIADCHSMYRAIRSMQEGFSLFISDVVVLNGDEIHWSSSIIKYMSICDPAFAEGLVEFGFTKKECRQIKERQLAAAFSFYLVHKDIREEWKMQGKPGFHYHTLIIVAYLFFRKILRIFGIRKSHIYKDVKISDFL